jgi:hypothetical protein
VSESIGVAIGAVTMTVVVFLLAFLMFGHRNTPEVGGCVIRQIERFDANGGRENVNYIVCPLPTEYQH